MSAAVADYKPKQPYNSKIKKQKEAFTLELVPTKDILLALGNAKQKGQLLIGFALETENGVENALKKLRDKNLDLIILNTLSDPGAGFKHVTNKITIIDSKENLHEFPLKTKKEVASDICDAVEKLF